MITEPEGRENSPEAVGLLASRKRLHNRVSAKDAWRRLRPQDARMPRRQLPCDAASHGRPKKPTHGQTLQQEWEGKRYLVGHKAIRAPMIHWKKNPAAICRTPITEFARPMTSFGYTSLIIAKPRAVRLPNMADTPHSA